MRYYLQCFYCQTGSAMYAKCILLGMPSYLLLLWCNMCSRWISTDTNNIVFLLMNKYSFFLVWLQPCACLFCDYPPIITHRRVQVQTPDEVLQRWYQPHQRHSPPLFPCSLLPLLHLWNFARNAGKENSRCILETLTHSRSPMFAGNLLRLGFFLL
jgi:hypothetical protein